MNLTAAQNRQFFKIYLMCPNSNAAAANFTYDKANFGIYISEDLIATSKLINNH